MSLNKPINPTSSIPTQIMPFLYNLTLQGPSSVVASFLGTFRGEKSQEIVVITASFINLWTADPDSGKLRKVVTQPAFGSIRAASSYRLAGGAKDYIMLTSDSGKLTILEYNAQNCRFQPVFNEPFAKSGLRRLSPGHYISPDAKGRAVMLTALEKNKLVYVLNRDSNDKLTISSPLEANRARILTLASCGLDVGYENPVFGALELEPGPKPTKYLTFYELDLGLNHVVKKLSTAVNSTCGFLLAIPGGSAGPSGALVGGEGTLSYFHQDGHVTLNAAIPCRKIARDSMSSSPEPPQIVCGAVHVMRGSFFVLVQSQYGDLFKVVVQYDRKKMEAEDITISYFDTIPLCYSISVLKSGFLYAASQHESTCFYQFVGLGQEAQAPEFEPQPLENLQLVDVVETVGPVTDATLVDGQIGALSGKTFKFLRRGWPLEEIAASELGSLCQGVFTCKLTSRDDYERYLVLSFAASTMVLTLGDSIEEADTPMITGSKTLGVQQMGVSSLVQIHEDGVCHMTTKAQTTTVGGSWLPPAGIKIVCCSSTNFQLVLGLSNREIVYLELDDHESLEEIGGRQEMPAQIVSVSLGDIPKGKLRSNFLAVSCNNQLFNLFSLDPKSPLALVSSQALSSNATSVLLAIMGSQLYLHLGLETGIYVKTYVSENGRISDRVIQYLGPNPIHMTRMMLNNDNAVFIRCGNAAHVGFHDPLYGFKSLPLTDPPNLQCAASFSSEEYLNGIVGTTKDSMYILSLEDTSSEFKSASVSLKYRGRKLALCNINNKHLYCIAETGLDENNKQQSCLQCVDEDQNVVQELDISGKTLCLLEVFFQSKNAHYLAVSTATDDGYCILCYSISKTQLVLVHTTKTDSPVHSMVPFSGNLLVGIGNIVRLYDMGQKQLLRQCETTIPGLKTIVGLKTQGLRVYVADIKESLSFAVFDSGKKQFVVFADDVIARHVTAFDVVDYDTIVAGDKFGNVFVLQCPKSVSSISEDQTWFLASKQQFLNAAANKLDLACHFYVSDIPTAIHKVHDPNGVNQGVVYTGLQGTIGMVIPLITKSEISFFQALEHELSQFDSLMVTGCNHLMHRGYYAPRKSVVDGDLCEQFALLTESEKNKVALKMDRSVREIEKKIVDLRLKVVF